MVLCHQCIRIWTFLGLEVIELHKLRAVDGQFQVKNIIVAGVERDAACFRLIQVSVHAEHDLPVEHEHLGLVLRDVRLEFAAHLAGEVACHLVRP